MLNIFSKTSILVGLALGMPFIKATTWIKTSGYPLQRNMHESNMYSWHLIGKIWYSRPDLSINRKWMTTLPISIISYWYYVHLLSYNLFFVKYGKLTHFEIDSVT